MRRRDGDFQKMSNDRFGSKVCAWDFGKWPYPFGGSDVFLFSPTPKKSQVGFEIMSLNIPMGGKGNLGSAGFIERFMKEEAGQSIR